jgi:hypothetical protein
VGKENRDHDEKKEEGDQQEGPKIGACEVLGLTDKIRGDK